MPKKENIKITKIKAKSSDTTTKNRSTVTKEPPKIKVYKNRVVIRFSDQDEMLARLKETVGLVSSTSNFSKVSAAPGDVLGGDRSRKIVSGCAQSNAWLKSLSDLGLSPLIFRSCVHNSVVNSGYVPPSIPATPTTRLIDVVAAIQVSPAANAPVNL